MNIKEITIDWLKKNGYTGLCSPELECGCPLEDLMLCGNNIEVTACEAGYEHSDGGIYIEPQRIELLSCLHKKIQTKEIKK